MTRAKKTVAEVPVIDAIKGFDADLKCRGYQFALGETFEHKGPVVACSSGFHSVENPFDVLTYYPASTSRYATVKASGTIARHTDDSKIASASIHIEAEIKLPDIIKRGVAYILSVAKGNLAVSGHAAATGDRGHAAATGYSGHAAATGDRGHAAATGYSGHAAATGYSGHAAATGDRGHAAATGYSGHAAATGYSGHAAATGYSGHAAATGDRGHAAATGYSGHAAATGYSGHAAATGDSGVAVSLGLDGTATAGATGWIVLAYCSPSYPYAVERVERFKVGEGGVEAGKSYRLNADGKAVECGK